MTVGGVQRVCGITYCNASYVLKTLKEGRLCHIHSWELTGGKRPMAIWMAGDGIDAVIGGEESGFRNHEIMVVADVMRTAVADWVKTNGDDDGNQQ